MYIDHFMYMRVRKFIILESSDPNVPVHCKQDFIYVFPEELHSIIPNVHIHVQCERFIYSHDWSAYFAEPIMGIYKSLTDTGVWNKAAQFHFCENLF
jgi:hypothetical protein